MSRCECDVFHYNADTLKREEMEAAWFAEALQDGCVRGEVYNPRNEENNGGFEVTVEFPSRF